MKNTGPKELNSNLLADTGFNIIDKKKLKKEFYQLLLQEQQEFYWKKLLEKLLVLKDGFSIFFRPLMTAGLPLMNNVLTPLAKRVFYH